MVAFVRDLADEYAGYWKKGTDDGAGAQRLAGEGVDILVAARLAVRDPADGISALPAAGRYAATDPVVPASALRPLEVTSRVETAARSGPAARSDLTEKETS